ncbi:VOC family protein [Nonomuraea sp. NPDC050310]|uniref:VOC family protein n=1 Tax=Nonomuraea sp. NPDC050310 TaxID=3154935 RepID=UPI0033DD7524
MSGRVVHFEIPADNVDRASAFYREAFGWQLQPVPEMDYTMVMTTPIDEQGMPTEAGGINGGMFDRSGEGGKFKTPVIVIDVSSVDEALEKVESLGGQVVSPKMAVGDMGFAGYFTDSEGNIMGLWESAQG